MTDDRKFFIEVTHEEVVMLHAALLAPALTHSPLAKPEEYIDAVGLNVSAAEQLGQAGMVALIDKFSALHNSMHSELNHVQGTAGLH